jgi:hypothetical protein
VIAKDFEKNWRFKTLPQEVTLYLSERENVAARKAEFDDKIKQLAMERVGIAKAALSNLLGVAAEDL